MLNGGSNNEEKASNEGQHSPDIGEADEEDHEHGPKQGNDDDMDVQADD